MLALTTSGESVLFAPSPPEQNETREQAMSDFKARRPLHALVTERSDLSQLTMCRPPQAGRTARVLCQNHWRGPRSVGARYKLRKVVCMEQSPPFRRVNLFTAGYWHPITPAPAGGQHVWAAVAYHAAAFFLLSLNRTRARHHTAARTWRHDAMAALADNPQCNHDVRFIPKSGHVGAPAHVR